MNTITAVQNFLDSKTGAPKVRIETTNGLVYLTKKQLNNEQIPYSLSKFLVGSQIVATYYEKGETLNNGEECTESGKLLKDYTIMRSQVLMASMFAGHTMAQAFASA